MCRAMCSASSSTRKASPITTSSIASSKSSGKRDMWTPFCARSRSTVQSISAAISFSASPHPAELVDELGLAARVRGGRYEPNLQPVDTLELARAAAEALGEERVRVGGPGGSVSVDVDATRRGIAALVQAALRHGGFDQVECHADGTALTIRPVTAASGPVLLGEDLRDLGAAVAVLLG